MNASAIARKLSKLEGKHVYALTKSGKVLSGKLVRLGKDRYALRPAGGKRAHTKAILPLALFDLLAIGSEP